MKTQIKDRSHAASLRLVARHGSSHCRGLEPLEGRRLLSAAVALTLNNQLLTFDTDAPAAITRSVEITGLEDSESILAIDYRPATGGLYGLGSGSRLYAIDGATGAATQIGSDFAVALAGDSFDLDFNPAVDRIRVVSNADQNLRLNPDTGAVVDFDAATAGVQTDGPLAYAAGDSSAGADPVIVAAAYDNNVFAAAMPTLYALDSAFNTLVEIGSDGGVPTSPNTGQLNTVGALGVDIGKRSGLDIRTTGSASTDTGFAVLQVVGQNSPQLYTINLDTGAATLVGAVGTQRVVDFAIATPPTVAIALTTKNELLAIDANNPTKILRRAKIRGLDAGENMLGIDFRPAILTGQLLGISSLDRLYTINPKTGRTAQVGVETAIALTGTDDGFGFDFNPTVDRIRLTSNADQNLRLNPETGAVVDSDTVLAGLQADGTLAYDTDTDGAGADTGDANAGADPLVTASAYTNNVTGATITTLFGIDTNLNILVTQAPPNVGTLNTVGSLGINAISRSGFDILTADGTDRAFAALQVDGQSKPGLYRINLTTGAATRVGSIGGNRAIAGLAVVPV